MIMYLPVVHTLYDYVLTSSILHDEVCDRSSEQSAPLPSGVGLVHVLYLVCTPSVPHVAEQAV